MKNYFSKKVKGLAIAIAPTVLLFFTICVLIPSLVLSVVAEMLNIEVYEQECPELVRAFLSSNYEQFETEVRKLCDDEEFMEFVATMEFDNAYTKMVFGGTEAYTNEELIGNYKGVQGQSAEWIAEKNGKYSAKSVISTILDYQKQGISMNDIYVRDEYLAGYTTSSGATGETSISFKEWIKSSFYNIPFFYWYGSNNEYGVNNGANLDYQFIQRDDKKYDEIYYRACAETSRIDYNEMSDPYAKRDMTPYSYMLLERLVGKYIDEVSVSDGAMTYDIKYMANNKKKLTQKGQMAFLHNAIYGYQPVIKDDWLTKLTLKLLMSKEKTMLEKTPLMSTTDDFLLESGQDFSKIEIKDIGDWFDYAEGGKNNIQKYLTNITGKEALMFGKRYESVNANLVKWKDNFAEYFAKEIYYTYPCRDYIVDYFLGKKVPRNKKVAFLQKSFYSMATGASLDLNLDETYKVENGEIYSELTENKVGSLNIEGCEVLKINPVGVYYENDSKEISKFSELKKEYREWEENDKGPFFTAQYQADIKIKMKGGLSKDINKVPVVYTITSDKTSSITINAEEKYLTINKSDYNSPDDITKIAKGVKINWDSIYYKSQYTSNDFDGTDKDLDRTSNPLDNVKVKLCNEWIIKKSLGKNTEFESEELDKENIEKIVYEIISSKEDNSPYVKIFDGELEGIREIHFEYSDHSFLNYHVSEQKDNSGKLESVNIEIYTYYPDLSIYNEGRYRVAYGFETPGAIPQAFALLQYVRDNQTLEGVKDAVDFEQLFIPLDEGWAKNGYLMEASDLQTFIAEMIIGVESGGNWSDAHNAMYGSEVTITVGIVQWYGGRAHKLLSGLCKKNPKEAKKKLGNALYNECLKDCTGACVWESKQRYFNEKTELEPIRELLGSDWGKEVQKEQLKKDIAGYIEIANNMGLTDDKLVAYFCQMYHQAPVSAKAVATRFINSYGSAIRANSTSNALDTLYQISMQKDVGNFYQYASRHQTCYEKCKNLTNITSNVKVAGTKKAKKAIQFAISKSGCPYSQAQRNSTTIFDCSNLMYAAWKYAGVDISNGSGAGASTEDELKWCETYAKKICSGNLDINKLKAGDLLFYDTNPSHYRNVGHISMYIGNGQVVEAGDPVGVYDIGNWHISNFMEAYRITDK